MLLRLQLLSHAPFESHFESPNDQRRSSFTSSFKFPEGLAHVAAAALARIGNLPPSLSSMSSMSSSASLNVSNPCSLVYCNFFFFPQAGVQSSVGMTDYLIIERQTMLWRCIVIYWDIYIYISRYIFHNTSR